MRIFVKAKPSAKEARIEKIGETHFIVSVKEPLIKGMANAGIIKILAEYFNIAHSRIKIISGYASRNKVVDIQND